MKQSTVGLGAIFLTLAPPSGASQDAASSPTFRPGVTLEEHFHREYGPEQGLPSGWVHALLQSRDGYVWVGTVNGLARFDGSRFTVFDTRNTPELAGNDVRALTETRDGSLWIGGTLGLTRLRPGRPGTFEAMPELEARDVRAIHEDHLGGLWAGTKGGLWYAQGGSDDPRFVECEAAPPDVLCLGEDETGTLQIGTDWGLFALAAGRFEKVTENNGWFPVGSLHRDARGLWVGTAFGLRLLTRAGLEDVEPGPRTPVEAVVAAPDGTLFAIFHNGVAYSSERGFVTIHGAGKRPSTGLVDREGGLWVGYFGDGGLNRCRGETTGAVLTDRRVYCLYQEPRGALWLGTTKGLVRLDGEVRTDFDTGFVWSLAPGEGDSIWIATKHGLRRWTAGRIDAVDQPPGLAGLEFQTVFEDSTGALWLARKGQRAHVLEHGELRELEELREGPTRWFHEDAEGRIWVGHQSGLFRSSAGGLERVELPGLEGAAASMLSVLGTPGGDLWIGTECGLLRQRDGGFDVFTVADGLAAEWIDRLGLDGSGRLWMGGRHGFSYAALEDLEDFAAGRTRGFRSHVVEEDLRMSEVVGYHGSPKSLVARDGTLYLVAGWGALTVPAEPRAPNPVPPAVHIEEVRVDGDEVDANEAPGFFSGARRVAIRFAAPSFTEPENVRIRYRLDGYDDDWNEAGRERVANYTNLAPGEYVFRVTAENEHGVRSTVDASLGLTVRPRWYEQGWVRTLGVLAVLAAGIGSYRARTRSIRRRNAALQREIDERKRAEEEARQHWDQLARVSRAASMGELTTSIAHEVKQPLFAIVSNAQTARRFLEREEPDTDEVREALQDIASDGNRASEIIDRIRSLVTKERDPLQEIDLNEVALEVVRLVDPEIRRRGLILKTDLAEDLPTVKGDPIELQQVLINLVLNGAQAMEEVDVGALTVGTAKANGSVTVTVQDEGVGLDEKEARRLFEPFYTTKPHGTGMGLAMNRAIIERHGGKIWATSNDGPGATFEFSLQANGNGNGS